MSSRSVIYCIIFFLIFTLRISASLMPNGGEQIPIGQYYTVSWSISDFSSDDNVVVYLWLQEKARWEQLSECAAHQKTFRWLVTHNAGNNYRIKVQSKKNPTQYLLSEAYFSIIIPSAKDKEGEFGTADKVRIRPNPLDGLGTFSWEGKGISIRIIAPNGNVVYSGLLAGTNSCTVDVKSFVQGLYIAEIMTENKETLTGKLYVIR